MDPDTDIAKSFRSLQQHKVLWLSLIGLVAYVILHYLTPPDSMKLTAEILLLGISVAMSHGWLQGAIDAFKHGASTDWDKGVLSVWGLWTSMVLQRIYAIIFIGLGRPEWLQQLPLNGLITCLFIITGVYALIAPMSNKLIPADWVSKERGRLFKSLGIGVGAMVLTVIWLWSRGWAV